MDESRAVHGGGDRPLDAEFVAFDIETTGLSSLRDRMTEIGAVLFSGGEVKAEFNTFVDPKMPIPAEITRLTGINAQMVAGAPDEAEALKKFLEFAGDRPLVAHNADFDVGFLSAAAARCGAAFSPTYIDTLVLARALMPNLKNHKLDTVSNFLSLPEFNHHRASDDALVAARIMGRFIPMLREKGVNTLGETDAALSGLNVGNAKAGRARHIIILVKNKVGLKNLY